ncbi:MAG TPA: helix-turn-helix domain-containing protein [Sphingomonas sp.]|nr:helix-turn-helix domain-containing protein [Sphingomonas sp.]
MFLREPELRRGLELLYFGYSHLTRAIDRDLSKQGLGRAHHRALYFIARKPDLTVSELLSLLTITKQSLGRVINELTERNLVETRAGERDRRQRLLRLTREGTKMESDLFEAIRVQMSAAYARAGQAAVSGYWAVLEGMVPEDKLAELESLRR